MRAGTFLAELDGRAALYMIRPPVGEDVRRDVDGSLQDDHCATVMADRVAGGEPGARCRLWSPQEEPEGAIERRLCA